MPLKMDGLTLVGDKPRSLIWKFPELFQLLLDVNLADETLVPGQPLEVRWRLNQPVGAGGGAASARIYVDGQLVREHVDVPISDAQQGTGWVDEHKITISDPNVATAVYRFGARRLELEVRAGDRLQRAVRGFTVGPEPFVLSWTRSQSWWWWQSLSSQGYEWKESFELVGDFINQARFARISRVEAGLSAVREDQTEPVVNPCDYDPPEYLVANDLTPGASHTFKFPLFYDWEWLASHPWYVKGPVTKTYVYGVWVRATDQFGNVYEGCAPLLRRHINVSQEKWALGTSAMTLNATAVALAVAAAATSWTLIGLVVSGGGAAAAYAAATAAGDEALDPPEPDFNYRERVRPARPHLPEWPREKGVPTFVALRDLLERALQLLALEHSRTETRAKLLGARLNRDEEARHLQECAYLDIVRAMGELAAPVEDIAERVRHELEEHPVLNSERWVEELDALAERGFRPEVEAELRKIGVTGRVLNRLRAAAGSPLAEFLETNGLSVVQIAWCLKRFVREIEGRTEHVLSGEEYVAPPPPSVRRDVGDRPEDQRRQRHSACGCRR